MPRARVKARAKTPEQVILENYKKKQEKNEESVEVSFEEGGGFLVTVETSDYDSETIIEGIESTQFPECCGVIVVHSFENMEDLEQPVANAVAQILVQKLKELKRAFASAALNHTQKKAFIALTSAGFEVVAKGENSNRHGIVMLTLPLHATQHRFAAA